MSVPATPVASDEVPPAQVAGTVAVTSPALLGVAPGASAQAEPSGGPPAPEAPGAAAPLPVEPPPPSDPSGAVVSAPAPAVISVVAAPLPPAAAAPTELEPPPRRRYEALDLPESAETSGFELEATSLTDPIEPPAEADVRRAPASTLRELDVDSGAAQPGGGSQVPLVSAWEFVGWTGDKADTAGAEELELARPPRKVEPVPEPVPPAPLPLDELPPAEEKMELASAWEFVPPAQPSPPAEPAADGPAPDADEKKDPAT